MKSARSLAVLLVIGSLAASCGGGPSTAPSTASWPTPTVPLTAVESASIAQIVSWTCLVQASATDLGPFARLPDPGCATAIQLLRASGVGQPTGRVALVAPGSPTNLTASMSGSTVTLQWTAPPSGDPATSYTIEAGSTPGAGNIVTFDTGNTATSFSASNVPPSTYYVRVRARNASGLSAPSNEVVVVAGSGPCMPPGAPTGFTGSVSMTTVTLTWNASVGAASYVLEAGSSPGASNIFSGDFGPQPSLSASAPAGTYYLRVRGRNACGLSQPSNEIVLVVAYVMETFSGRAFCYGYNTFTMSQAGLVEAQFLTITGATSLNLRLIDGVCPDSCRIVADQIVGPGVLVRANLSAGTRTVSGGSQPCSVSSPPTYTVQVTHPQ